ncbi:hypothetical protein BDR04DRAFT_1086600 [Suillus decipiens]|nr:hypothetical protein BDR04DRAFT_1086600 [Suillus decipiens]
MAAFSQSMSPNYPLQNTVGYPLPIQPGSQSPPLNASTGSPTVSDHTTPLNQALYSRQSSNPGFAVYGDAQSSAISSDNRRMATIPETLLSSPWEMNPVSYLGPPVQSGFQPSPINAAVAKLAAREFSAAFNQTQPSNTDFAVKADARVSDMISNENMTVAPRPASPLPRKEELVYLSPPGSQAISTSADNIADLNTDAGSQSMASASAQTAITAAGQTAYQSPTRVMVHTDVDDVMPNSNGVVELPPQYSEHRGVRAM